MSSCGDHRFQSPRATPITHSSTCSAPRSAPRMRPAPSPTKRTATLRTRYFTNPPPNRHSHVVRVAAPDAAAPAAGPLGDATARSSFHLACPICQTTTFDVPASAAA